MKRIHLTHCLLGIAAGVGLLLVFGPNAGTFVYLAAVLACPLMMVFMMRAMMHGAGHGACDHPDHRDSADAANASEPAGRAR